MKIKDKDIRQGVKEIRKHVGKILPDINVLFYVLDVEYISINKRLQIMSRDLYKGLCKYVRDSPKEADNIMHDVIYNLYEDLSNDDLIEDLVYGWLDGMYSRFTEINVPVELISDNPLDLLSTSYDNVSISVAGVYYDVIDKLLGMKTYHTKSGKDKDFMAFLLVIINDWCGEEERSSDKMWEDLNSIVKTRGMTKYVFFAWMNSGADMVANSVMSVFKSKRVFGLVKNLAEFAKVVNRNLGISNSSDIDILKGSYHSYVRVDLTHEVGKTNRRLYKFILCVDANNLYKSIATPMNPPIGSETLSCDIIVDPTKFHTDSVDIPDVLVSMLDILQHCVIEG